MKTHIRRKHGGRGESSQTVQNKSRESNDGVTTTKMDESYINESRQFGELENKHNDTISFLDQMRKMKELKQLFSELDNSSTMLGSNILQLNSAAVYRAPAVNSNSFSPNQQVQPPTINSNSFSPNQGVEPPGSGTTLGYEAFVCDRCLRVALQEVLDSAPRRSIKFNHMCNEQVARGPHMKDNFTKDLMIRKQFLINCLVAIVTTTSQYQEKAKLIAVPVPGFGWGLDEEFIDLDPVKRDIPSWAYNVAQTGEALVDKAGLQEYLEIFGSTFAFFRLTTEKPKFYFVYISNGLEPKHLKYIRRLFEPRTRTDFYSTPKVPNRPQSTKLSDMISFVHVGKDSIPVLKLSPMQFYQTSVLSWRKAQ
jgi:hypothetical protein